MSLTSQLRAPHVQAVLREVIRNPGLIDPPPVVVPSAPGIDHRLIGMAIDYAVRFGLNARYDCKSYPLIVERTMRSALLGGPLKVKLEDLYQQAWAWIKAADFGADSIPEDAARALLDFARLERMYRSGHLNWPPRERNHPADVAQIQALFEIVPWRVFKPQRRLLLNPDFKVRETCVRAADADLILDDALLDIKTRKESRLDDDDVHQIVGYVLLAEGLGITGHDGLLDLTRGGIYLARAGVLHTFAIADCIAEGDRERLLEALLRPT